ncbi:MAG: hypothetical protein QNI99_03325 [Woeseiaceae bacterium]|nr:hypothetical protein [Woeseiaceae bacterium]
MAQTDVDRPAEVFTTLLDRLTDKYPCITHLSDEDVEELGVWLDGPLHPVRQEAPVLGLISERVNEVLPFVIDTANELGLTVYDYQTGDLHRPGKRAANYEKMKSEPQRMSSGKLSRSVDKALKTWLEPLGFKWDKNFSGCSRWQNGYYIFIACLAQTRGGETRAEPYSWAGFADTRKIINHFYYDGEHRPDSSDDIYIEYANFVHSWNKGIACNRVEDQERFLRTFKSFVMERLLPLLESYSDPQKLIDLYLSKELFDARDFELPNWRGCKSAVSGLVLARLYRPKVYKKLKRRYKRQFREITDDDKKKRVKRLIAYLDRKELTPIV